MSKHKSSTPRAAPRTNEAARKGRKHSKFVEVVPPRVPAGKRQDDAGQSDADPGGGLAKREGRVKRAPRGTTPPAHPDRGNPALRKLSGALRDEYNKVRQLLADADAKDALARYRIAEHFERVRLGEGRGGTYGDRAVPKLAAALDWSESTVYEFAAVAKVWKLADFTVLTQKLNCRDLPLSWSHFVAFAAEPVAKRRNKLIDDTLKNGWSVRQLRDAATKLTDPPGPRKDSTNGSPPEPTGGPAAGGPTGGSSGDLDEPKGTVKPRTGKPAEPELPRQFAVTLDNFLLQINVFKQNIIAYGTQLTQGPLAERLPDATLDLLRQTRSEFHDLAEITDIEFNKLIETQERLRQTHNDTDPAWDEGSADRAAVDPTNGPAAPVAGAA